MPEPLIQIPIQFLLEVPLHPGDQRPELMDDSIQLPDSVVRDGPEAAHVMRFEFLDSDIYEVEIGEDRSGSRNLWR